MKDHVSYKDVLETLKSDIFGGKYASSRKFPSSTALARRFKATRFTIRQALDRLTQAGLIQSRKGCGTYVTVKAIPQKMGLIIPGLGCGEIFPPICQEISRLAQKRGLPLLFGGDSSSSPAVRAQRAMELARQFVEQGVSGVIFQPMEFYADAARYNKAIVSVFEKAGVPVVLLDCDIVPSPARSKCDIVGINNFEVGRRLALHLREQGAKRIRFLIERFDTPSLPPRECNLPAPLVVRDSTRR